MHGTPPHKPEMLSLRRSEPCKNGTSAHQYCTSSTSCAQRADVSSARKKHAYRKVLGRGMGRKFANNRKTHQTLPCCYFLLCCPVFLAIPVLAFSVSLTSLTAHPPLTDLLFFKQEYLISFSRAYGPNDPLAARIAPLSCLKPANHGVRQAQVFRSLYVLIIHP